jgi:exopolyphosphatase/guanosine-5'-triphosphate,3'-diphosphate pyrophosphatase
LSEWNPTYSIEGTDNTSAKGAGALKAAIIDLGFNSVKMVCYSVDRNAKFRAYRQDAYRSRLGEGLDETGFLGVAQMKRTIGYLKILGEIAAMESIETIVPIATSAVREASNGSEFVKTVLEETKLAFRSISARDEALYSFAGAAGFSPSSDIIFFDLGGGSLEVVIASDFKIRKVLSLPLGALRLSLEYGDGMAVFERERLKSMKKRILETLQPLSGIQASRRTRLVGAGGTARAIARRDQELSEYPFAKIQSHQIPYASVNSLSKSFLKMSQKELAEEREIGNRAETIAAGTLVIKLLMKTLVMREFTVSAHGLREGALSMYLLNPKSFHAGTVSKVDVERFVRSSAAALRRSIEGYPLDMERVGIVNRREAALLAEALRLVSSVLPTVNLRSFFYSILEEESTVSQHEQLIIAAAAVTAKNDRISRLIVSQYRELLSGSERDDVRRLANCFALMETLHSVGSGLKMSRRGADLSIRMTEGKTRLPVSLLTHQAEAVCDLLGLGLNLTFRSNGKELPVTAEVGA